jgi:hypothetical protein
LILLGIGVLSGCQKGASGDSSASTGDTGAQASADPSKEPAAIATADLWMRSSKATANGPAPG